MRRTPTRHTGMTLIEVLAALSILSMFVVLVTSWMTGSVRRHRQLVERTAGSSTLDRIMEAISADLSASAPNSIEVDEEHARITCRTTHRLPGDPPGWHQVTWQRGDAWGEDRTGGLVRFVTTSQGGDHRVIARDVDGFEVLTQSQDERITLRINLVRDSDRREQRWELVP